MISEINHRPSSIGHQPLGPGRRWRRFLKRALVVVAVVFALVVGAAVWLARSLPEIIAAQIGRATNTRVEAGVFEFHLNGSVSIDELVIRPRQEEPGYDNAILHAKDVHVRLDRGSLVSLAPRVTDLRVEDFMLDVQLNLDTGRWNVGALQFHKSGGTGGGPIPTIQLQQGKLRYSKISSGEAEVVMSVPVEGSFGVSPAGVGYSFEIRTSKLSGGYGESRLSGNWRPGELTVTGGLSSADLPSLAWAWAVDVLAAELRYDGSGDYRLNLRMKDLHGKQAPEVDALRQIIPAGAHESGSLAGLQRFFTRYRPTGTVGSITINAGGNLHRLRDSEVTGTLVCEDVSVCDSRFPYQIDHLAGALEFTQSSVLMRPLLGRHGDVNVQIEGWTKGYGAERQYHYKVTSGNMVLDDSLYAALQPGQKRLWEMFQPSGVIAADYRLVRTSPTDKRIYTSVDLKGVSARFRDFPYPLTGLTGRLYFDRDSISATDVLSESGGRRIRVNAKVTGRAAGKPIHYISIDANDVPLDATLERTLPEHYRRLYAQLDVNGVADVRGRVFSTGDANSADAIGFLADVVCRSRSLKLEQLPVVLSNVTAELAVSPDAVNLQRLSGRYGHSRVALTGAMQLGGDDRSKAYRASVTAEELPIDETTIGVLPKSLAQVVAAFRPQGHVNLAMELQQAGGDAPPVYEIDVDCLGGQIDHRRFPYPLRNVRGHISFADNKLVVKNLTATPADPCQMAQTPGIRIDGSAQLAEGALAGGSFSLKAQDLLFTESLGKALPKGLTDVYRSLSPRGPFDLDLATLTISGAAQDQMLVEFGGQANLKTCTLHVAGTGMEVSGAVRAEGSYGTKQGLSKGLATLVADRLTVKGKTIADMTVDAIYDPNAQKWSAESFVGDCHGGRVLGDVEVGRAPDGAMQYLLQMAFHRVDLQQFLAAGKAKAQEDSLGHPASSLQSPASSSGGVMNAALSLSGHLGAGSSRRGTCQVDIENMQVGKVSPLGNLLSVLRLNEPTDYMFERMLIDSYIKQDALLIRKLDISGRNVAFAGSGTMTLPQGELNLTLTARGRRVALAEPSVLQALTEGLGGGVVRMEVTGGVDNPHVETKALPLIEDSLRILGTPR